MNSKDIEHGLNIIKDRKSKNAFLESIMSDPTAVVLNETNGHKTVLYPGNKGPKSSTWNQTRQMAFELNDNGFDVAFLPELKRDISADSLIRKGSAYRIADFKYCITTKSNTLAKDLEHGFKQASTIVLKLKNMDSGVFKETVDYLLRNKKAFGDLVLLNKYGRLLMINYREIKTKSYIRKIKGFL